MWTFRNMNANKSAKQKRDDRLQVRKKMNGKRGGWVLTCTIRSNWINSRIELKQYTECPKMINPKFQSCRFS